MLVHGDEGRGPKRQAVMCLSVASILGKGVTTRSKRAAPNRSDKQLMNYTGHSYATRFLLGVLPKEAYESDPSVFQAYVDTWAGDLRKLALDGIASPIDGQQFYVAVLHVKGDWPFLVKVGELNRSFYNAPKRASSQKDCTGICHLCEAGRPGVPYEDLRSCGEWQFTVGISRPWVGTPAVFQIPHDPSFPEFFLSPDPFHTWHLGEGRHFVANCIKLILPLANGTNNDDRLSWLFADYRTFCKSQGRQCYAVRFGASLFRIVGNEFPTGSWTKGNFTTSLVKWMNHFLNSRRHTFPDGSDFKLAVPWQQWLAFFFFVQICLHGLFHSEMHIRCMYLGLVLSWGRVVAQALPGRSRTMH